MLLNLLPRRAHPFSGVCFRRYASAVLNRDSGLALDKDGSRILGILQKRIEERAALTAQISDDMSSPGNIARMKQLKDSEPLQEAWDEWTNNRKLLDETAPLLTDPDVTMRNMATDEFRSLTETLTETLNKTFPSLLIPPSTTSQLSALMELKSGVGGSEASLFLSDLLRMYLRQANINRWKVDIVASNESEGGGTKDAIVEIKGDGVYDALRWESGVHRVQRVPATESSGRVHTSTVAVVVLPLEDEAKRNNDNDLFSMDDIRVEVMRARGAGGQHVNKTESAVRLTHIPTGITVSMQDERSQHQNKRRAFQVLQARLLDRKITQDIAQRRDTRRNLVRTADRSEKIRTYNYAQDRVTDHRIGLTLTNLTSILEGDGLGEILDALKRDYDESVLEDMLNSD